MRVREGLSLALSEPWLQMDFLEPPHCLSKAGKADDGAVGLLTSASIEEYQDVFVRSKESDGEWARCMATGGLSNALRIGGREAGSCTVAASLEALSLAAEARTLALCESGVPSRVSQSLATGTGTDGVVIVSPVSRESDPASVLEYAGKHTKIGLRIGQAVFSMVSQGVAPWKAIHHA